MEHISCVLAYQEALKSGLIPRKEFRPACFGEYNSRVCPMLPCPLADRPDPTTPGPCEAEQKRLIGIGLSVEPVKEMCPDCYRYVAYPEAHKAYHRGIAAQQQSGGTT